MGVSGGVGLHACRALYAVRAHLLTVADKDMELVLLLSIMSLGLTVSSTDVSVCEP